MTNKGRPKGARNEADLLKELLETKMRARIGEGRVTQMTVAEAIVRIQFSKAAAGDKRARKCVFDFLDKIGLGTDVTAEERERRTLKLPRPLTPDEFDFENAPARERERQFFYAHLDRQNPDARDVSAVLREADELADTDQIAEALAAYVQEIERCKGILADAPNNASVKRDYDRAVARIGLLADRQLLAGDFSAATNCVAEALAIDKALENDATNRTWIGLVGAHANMLMGCTNQARNFYLGIKSDKRIAFTSWETLILQDFARLRRAGHSFPLMPEIETALFDAGWTAEPGRIREAADLKMTGEEQTFVLLHPHHLETAAILTKYNRLDDAAAIYRNNLEKFRAALVREPDNAEARNMLMSIALQFGLLAKKFVLAGLFGTAHECLNDLVSVAPDNLPLQAAYAHALMFIGKRDEAEQIYLQHRGKQVAGERWEDLLDNDFSQLHHARRTDPLMDSIRRRFAFDNEVPIVPQHATPSSPARAIAKPSQDPPIPDLADSDTVAAGDQLVLENRLDEAIAVYRRRLNICAAKLINGRVNMQALDDRQHVLDDLSDVAFGWIRERQPQQALDVADEALAVLPKTASANVRRAHALMLLNRPQEARAVYQLYWTAKASPDKTWKDAIRDDFAVMRSWDITHSLMEELDPTQVRPRKLIR